MSAKKCPAQCCSIERGGWDKSHHKILCPCLLEHERKEKAMRKKPEYKIIWVTPPDPVKLGTIMGEIYARGRGLEFVGLVPNGKDSGGAK